MNWYFIFYLFSLADKIGSVTGTLAIISGIIFGITLIVWIFARDSDLDAGYVSRDKDDNLILDPSWQIWRTFFWSSFMMFSICITIWTLIPNRDDMLLIIAGGAVGEFVVNDDNAKEIPADITRFLRKEILDATMEEGNEVLKETLNIPTKRDTLMQKSKEELINLLEQ